MNQQELKDNIYCPRKIMSLSDYKEDQRVATYDVDGSLHYGVLLKSGPNDYWPNSWYVRYDDGEECYILDWGSIYIAAF